MRILAASPPDDDKRWRIVNATMRRHGYSPHALIETLHTVQESFGFLDETSMRYVAYSLRIPLSRVYGVATFYNHFMMKPKGAHNCVVCLGTACYIKHSTNILEKLQQTLQIEPGETTPDGQISLTVAHCVGMCWLAPVLLFDNEAQGDITPEAAIARVQEWMSNVTETT